MRRIKVVIPNAGMSRSTLDERERMLSVCLDSSTSLSVDCILSGPETIESLTDEVLAESSILKQAVCAESDGFDAFVVYCFSDPGVRACRELVSIPVVGAGEAALAAASCQSYNFSIITTRPDNVLRTRARIEGTLFGRMLCSVRSLGIDVASLREDENATKNALSEACKLVVESDGAKLIILGCLGMANYGREISDALGVPVLDPAFISVATAEMMIKSGVRHSRRDRPQVNNVTRALLNNRH